MKENIMKKTIIVISVLFFVCLPCFTQEIAQESPPNYTPYFPNYPPLTPEEMMEFAKHGAEYLENGGDIGEFNKNPGQFTKGVFLDYRYLAVADCRTKTVLAHPFMPKVLNVQGLMYKTKDARGRAYNAELCAAVQKNPKGAWNVAFIKKPGEETIDLLYQYNIQVKDTDLVVAVFSRNLRIESHLVDRSREEEAILNSLVE
jgi:hypothetical protein